jgi:hypothetical protein
VAVFSHRASGAALQPVFAAVHIWISIPTAGMNYTHNPITRQLHAAAHVQSGMLSAALAFTRAAR